ncbi:M48 family metallopeptidase [Desulfopila sp. IMCC35008]|uniref:beta-barrel assembly-enhancing protease n=1 Tax=Desulfopila sp. IMCC35008 TaxID=2653858 RepID=UPI0013D45E70|nr:M48 family metallopeptidase [Desulfopila sp. IMCC35008]
MDQEFMMKRFRAILATLLALLVFNLTLMESAHAFSIGEEREVGEKLLYSVRTAFPLIDDPDLVAYLTTLGEDVLEVTGIQYFDYHFFLIQSNEFNAFAAPSGLVFFYTGLISAMNSEEEFVSVLAHEIGHVVKRHLAGRIEKGKIIGVASMAVAIAALALGGGEATQALLTGSLAAGQSATLHFSRKDEEEADRLAYDWMKQLGKDPAGQAAMLKTMRRVSRYRSEKLPQYLLTHPNPEDRLDYVEGLISSDHELPRRREERDQFNFLRFKYRIMSKVSDSVVYRAHLANVLSDSRSTEFDRIMAKYGLSQIERVANNHVRSLKLLDEVLEVFPDRQILYTDKGVSLYSAGRLAEAISILEKSWALDNEDLYAAEYLARCYQALGDFERANTLYKTVSYGLPEYSKIYFELGKIATSRQKQGEASLYLGKYYLYEGKLKLATFSLHNVAKLKTADDAVRKEAETLLEQIKRLEKK